MIELSEDSEEDIVASSPAKRRKRNVEYTEPQTPNVRSEQDQLDLEEDLEDIQDSGMSLHPFYLYPGAKNVVVSSHDKNKD